MKAPVRKPWDTSMGGLGREPGQSVPLGQEATRGRDDEGTARDGKDRIGHLRSRRGGGGGQLVEGAG